METIILYHKSDFTAPIYAERDEVYGNRNTLYDEYYITVVDAFVFHTSWRMFLQKRSMNKKVSPGLLHTSVGGHVNVGEPIEYTLAHETMEEFWYPSILVPHSIGWEESLEKFVPYLDRWVLMKQIFTGPIDFIGTDWQKSYDIFNDFIGIFGGEPENLDKSAECFIPKTLEEIDELISTKTDILTTSFIKHYEMHREQFYVFREVLLKYVK